MHMICSELDSHLFNSGEMIAISGISGAAVMRTIAGWCAWFRESIEPCAQVE
jgi:hypothetical protein